MSKLFSKSTEVNATKNVSVSGVDEVVGEDTGKKSKKENKGLISSSKKDKKKSKEKETRYAHLGDESSGEDDADGKSPLKIKKPKPFMFGSNKKEKEKKKEKEAHAKSLDFESLGEPSTEKKKEKKDKHKLKLVKKSKQLEKVIEKLDHDKSEELCIFSVPLEMAVERQRCHDGIPLPMVVRLCIDHVEQTGLMLEGIYRSSGVKSKVNKLRAAFNSRTCAGVNLHDFEPAVVASVLKLYLRELPEPVLTDVLMPKFEEISTASNPQKRIEGMKQLIASLPECNRALLTWIFIHMGHVIERERFNKMTLQNVSIVLSPTMRISHRVLNCFFENSHILFDEGQFKKYVPPITSSNAVLPETEAEIEAEIRKQESLLADLHLQISSGAASKKTEEQIWEQQRIVTQLKRKLRTAKKDGAGGLGTDEKKFETIDYEEELDFSLRVPSRNEDSISQASRELTVQTDAVATDNKVTVKVQEEPSEEQQQPSKSHVTVIKVQEEPPKASTETAAEQHQASVKPTLENTKSLELKSNEKSSLDMKPPMESKASLDSKTVGFPLLPPPPSSSNKTRVPHSSILKPTPASPPPTMVAKPKNLPTLQVIDSNAAQKSKSLPRGFPSDEFTKIEENVEVELSTPTEEDIKVEQLQIECLRLKLEYEELMAVRNELEQRKKSEYKEMEDLREEIATMQTLYHYRTYSVDSSESSSDEGCSDKDVIREEVEELNKVLADLVRENRELEVFYNCNYNLVSVY